VVGAADGVRAAKRRSGNRSAILGAAGGVVVLLAGFGILVARSDTSSPSPDSSSSSSASIRPFELDLSGSSSPAPSIGEPVAVSVEQVAPPPPPKPPLGEFEFHHKRGSSGDSYYVLGQITNTGEVPLDHPKLIIVLKDEAGEEVGTDFGFAERDVIYPGQASPISALVNDPPKHSSVEYELILRKASYLPARAEGLELESPKVTRGQWGNAMVAKGKVRNDGDKPAKFVKVEIHGLDADGKLLGLHTTYADGDVLAPGETARFSALSMFFDQEPANYEFYVGGRIAD
jgi:hypothetical protein